MIVTGTGEIKDEVKRIVGQVSQYFKEEVVPKLPENRQKYFNGITFFWGNPLELIATLEDYTKHDDLKYEKFPFIGLYNDIPIYKNKYGDYDGTLLELVFATSTDPTLDSNKRELESFKPLLRPIYGKFMELLAKSHIFVINDVSTDLKHTLTERYYWGRSNIYGRKAQFNDYLDAIQVSGLDLKLKNYYCS